MQTPASVPGTSQVSNMQPSCIAPESGPLSLFQAQHGILRLLLCPFSVLCAGVGGLEGVEAGRPGGSMSNAGSQTGGGWPQKQSQGRNNPNASHLWIPRRPGLSHCRQGLPGPRSASSTVISFCMEPGTSITYPPVRDNLFFPPPRARSMLPYAFHAPGTSFPLPGSRALTPSGSRSLFFPLVDTTSPPPHCHTHTTLIQRPQTGSHRQSQIVLQPSLPLVVATPSRSLPHTRL